MLESHGVKDILQPLYLKLEQACEPCPASEGEAVSLSLGSEGRLSDATTH